MSQKRMAIWLLLFLLGFSLTACNRKDNGVAPNLSNPGSTESSLIKELPSAAYFNDRFTNLGSETIAFNPDSGFVPKVRAAVYLDPKGENLALRCGANLKPYPYETYAWGPAGWQVPYFGFNHTYLVDGNPSTGIWFPTVEGHPLIMAAFLWSDPTPFPVGRFYTVANGVQAYQLLYRVRYDWQIATSGTPISTPSGLVIDITLDPPIMTTGMGVALTGDGESIGLMEFGFYEPASTSIRITSPTNNGPFIFGETIHFVGSYSGALTNVSWESNLDGILPGSYLINDLDNLQVGSHIITLKGKDLTTGQWVSATKAIEVFHPKIEIVNLDGPGGSADETPAVVSYRKAKTHFKAIGHRPDGSIVDPYSVAWTLDGGAVLDYLTPLKFGVLSLLTTSTTIGDFETWLQTVPKSPIATFVSYLPGTISVIATRGTGVASVAVRIKQPTIRVDIHPIEGMDVTSILGAWTLKAKEVWEKDDIIKIDSINLDSEIPNIIYPNSPLDPLPSGYPSAEPLILSELLQLPSYLNPLVKDYLSRSGDGKFLLPRQLREPFMSRVANSINVYIVEIPRAYDAVPYPDGMHLEFVPEDVYSISSREFNVFDSTQSGVVIRQIYVPTEESKKILGQGMGLILGLPKSSGWFQNFMDFGTNGGVNIQPEQIVAALNYNDDNPQNLSFIVEK